METSGTTRKHGITGYIKCPVWLKEAYRRGVNYKCQLCGCHEEIVGKLVPHRIKRGNKGGLYTVCRLNDPQNNIKVVCSKCHKLIHSNEQGGGSHSY